MITTISNKLSRVKGTKRSSVLLLLALAFLIAMSLIITAPSGMTSASAEPQDSSVKNALEHSENNSPQKVAERVANEKSLFKSTEYLTFNRWKGVTNVPIPDREIGKENVSGMPVFLTIVLGGAAQLLYSISSTILWGLGMLLTFSVSMDVISSTLSLVDLMFARAGLALFHPNSATNAGNSMGAVTLIAIVVGLMIITVVAKLALPGARMLQRVQISMKNMLVALGVLVGLMLVSNQAIKNHSETATAAGVTASTIATTQEGESSAKQIEKLSNGDEIDENGNIKAQENNNAPSTGTMSDWAIMSPGWIVMSANTLINNVAGIFSSIVDNITKTISSSATQVNSCSAYVDGMHQAFLSTAASRGTQGRSNMLISFDNVVNSIYFEPYRVGVFAESVGSKNAFCRMADSVAERSPGDQIFVSRQAGLYREIIGYGDLIPEGSRPTVPYNYTNATDAADGSIVKSSGAWKEAAVQNDKHLVVAETVASNIFGPSYGDDKGFFISQVYWASCIWDPGKDVRINQEWQDAQMGGVKEDEKRVINQEACGKDNADKNKGNTQIWGFSPYSGFGISKDEKEKEKTWWQKTWEVGKDIQLNGLFGATTKMVIDKTKPDDRYRDASGFYYNVNNDDTRYSNFMGLKSSVADSKISKAKQPQSKEYFERIIGKNAHLALVPGVMTAVSSLMTGWYLSPLILGATFAQLLGMMILGLGWILILLLMIPSARARALSISAGWTIIVSLVFSTMLTIFFTFVFFLVRVTMLLFTPFMMNGFLRGSLGAAAVIIALMLVRKVIMKLSNGQFDMRKMKSSWELGSASASPLMSAFKLDHATPRELFDKFGGRRNTDPDGDPLSTDDNTRQYGNRGTDLKNDADSLRRNNEMDKNAKNKGKENDPNNKMAGIVGLGKRDRTRESDTETLMNRDPNKDNRKDNDDLKNEPAKKKGRHRDDAKRFRDDPVGKGLDAFRSLRNGLSDPSNTLNDTFEHLKNRLNKNPDENGDPRAESLTAQAAASDPSSKKLSDKLLGAMGIRTPETENDLRRGDYGINSTRNSENPDAIKDQKPEERARNAFSKLMDRDTNPNDKNTSFENAENLAGIGSGQFTDPSKVKSSTSEMRDADRKFLSDHPEVVTANDEAIQAGQMKDASKLNDSPVEKGRHKAGDHHTFRGEDLGWDLSGMKGIFDGGFNAVKSFGNTAHRIAAGTQDAFDQYVDNTAKSMSDASSKMQGAMGRGPNVSDAANMAGQGANAAANVAGAGATAAGQAAGAAANAEAAKNAGIAAGAVGAAGIVGSMLNSHMEAGQRNMQNAHEGAQARRDVRQEGQRSVVTENNIWQSQNPNVQSQGMQNHQMGEMRSSLSQTLDGMQNMNDRTVQQINSNMNLLGNSMTSGIGSNSEVVANMIGRSNMEAWSNVVRQMAGANAQSTNGTVNLNPEQARVVEKVTHNFQDRVVKGSPMYDRSFLSTSRDEKVAAEQKMFNSLLNDLKNVTINASKSARETTPDK